MLITDSFVYIHMSKTGGTFVTAMLERIYKTRTKPNFLKKIRNKIFGAPQPKMLNTFKHGTCSDIPSEYSHLPIFSTIRNPYDRYVSEFEFQKAKDMDPKNWPTNMEVRKFFLENPDISFEEYVKWRCTHDLKPFQKAKKNTEKGYPGTQTRLLIQYYGKNPIKLFEKVVTTSISREEFLSECFDIKFIHMENLNTELVSVLEDFGLSRKSLDFIINQPKIRPPKSQRSDEQKWEKYYTPELKEFVREKDRIFFKIFPEYDDY
jgi:hypothetical protein